MQAVALHPRTREQGYSGKADWSRIAASEGRGEDSGDRQRRYRYARRCRADGEGDRLRRGDDRPHRIVESVDLPPDQQYLATGAYEQPTARRTAIEMMRTYYAMLLDRERRRCGREDEAVRHVFHAWRAERREAARRNLSRATKRRQILEMVDAFFERELP